MKFEFYGLQCSVTDRTFNGVFVSECEHLDITSQGRTLEEARNSLQDSIILIWKYKAEKYDRLKAQLQKED